DFARALMLVDIGDREVVRAAGEAIFVRHADEIPVYRSAFERFWRRPGIAFGESPRAPRRERAAMGSEDDNALGDEAIAGEGELARRVGYSPLELLRHRSFDQMTAAELQEAQRLIDQLGVRVALRRTRRSDLHPHGRLLAPRVMLRRNLGNGAEPLEWVWRRPVRRPRSMVVLCDISGSMERHARLLLRFVHALGRGPVRVESFVFGTRLTRITRAMRERNADRALARVTELVEDWSGGTRIGDAFRAFNLRWARRVLPSSGVVIVLSDGWDRGNPALVGEETARLERSCHRLVWLNPLAAADGYQPLAAGMAAARPFVDHFLPAANLAHLEELGALLGLGDRTVGRAA
ncbi:MAG: vWA domain-containing protein, partial [Candidatus Limnocylindria bacterium]